MLKQEKLLQERERMIEMIETVLKRLQWQAPLTEEVVSKNNVPFESATPQATSVSQL